MIRKLFLVSLLIISTVIFLSCRQNTTSRLIVTGFTKSGENGLSVFNFNDKTGEVSLVSQSDAGPNPSYFCYSAKKNLLYALNEVTEFKGSKGGGLTTMKLNENGPAEKLNEMHLPYGGGCFISMSPDSGHLFIANYPKGSVEVIKLGQDGIPEKVTDTILYATDTTIVSHAHMIMSDPAGKKIYVSDLGLDRMMVYDFDMQEGRLHPVDTLTVPKGSGPRHFTFNKDGSKLYLICELASRMIVFDMNAAGGPKLIQNLQTYREGFTGKTFCADVHIGKDGKYLYGSNRGENTIVTFNIDPDGTLKLAGHTTCGGNWPRNFVVHPSGDFLLAGNERSDTVAVFRIDNRTGVPIEPGKKYSVTAPACLKFY